MKKYRIKAHDVVHNIWVLQERRWWFFWVPIGTGGRDAVQAHLDRLNA